MYIIWSVESKEVNLVALRSSLKEEVALAYYLFLHLLLMHKLFINVKWNASIWYINCHCYRIWRLYPVIFFLCLYLVYNFTTATYPTHNFSGPLQAWHLQCISTHYAKGEIVLHHLWNIKLHILPVFYWMFVVKMIKVLIVEDTLNVSTRFGRFDFVFSNILWSTKV